MNAEGHHHIDLLFQPAISMTAIDIAGGLGIATADRLDDLVVLLD